MATYFGVRVRELRESKNLTQRDVARQLDIDTPMLSKIESGERKARKTKINCFAVVLNTCQDELLTLWLADKILNIVEGEIQAVAAIRWVGRKLNNKTHQQN